MLWEKHLLETEMFLLTADAFKITASSDLGVAQTDPRGEGVIVRLTQVL